MGAAHMKNSIRTLGVSAKERVRSLPITRVTLAGWLHKLYLRMQYASRRCGLWRSSIIGAPVGSSCLGLGDEDESGTELTAGGDADADDKGKRCELDEALLAKVAVDCGNYNVTMVSGADNLRQKKGLYMTRARTENRLQRRVQSAALGSLLVAAPQTLAGAWRVERGCLVDGRFVHDGRKCGTAREDDRTRGERCSTKLQRRRGGNQCKDAPTHHQHRRRQARLREVKK